MSKPKKKIAIIIGAGPAGLTAAYELLEKTNIIPIIYEQDTQVGGLSRTVNYKGNRIDIGGHRFFSKSDTVVNWWKKILPLQNEGTDADQEYDRLKDPRCVDNIMLVRHRLSRIFFLRRFFNYPVSLSFGTLKNLGIIRVIKIGLSYLKVRLFPIKNETSLEDFFINRFGKELYKTFFKDYTKKVWGVPCSNIDASWGAQRIKGLSVSKAIMHAVKSIFSKNKSIAQKDIETSLIGRFMYPKFGPGQMWERVAQLIEQKGGKIYLNSTVVGVKTTGASVKSVLVQDKITHKVSEVTGEHFFSSMPVKDLIEGFQANLDKTVYDVASGLGYRDFITVGLLLKKLKIKNKSTMKTPNNIVPDNWIYIQERDVKIGRLQIFNNWSPYMVKNKNNVWMGLEYFCNQGDALWRMSDAEFKTFAIAELCKIGFIKKEDVLDSVVIRMPKTYPAYFGTYKQFNLVKNFLCRYENLFLIGRNGMHRYNNMDHSMLTAMQAVQNIVDDIKTKENIWAINSQEEYHEEKARA